MTDHTTAILAGSHLRKRWDGALPRLKGRTFGPPTDPTRRRALRIRKIRWGTKGRGKRGGSRIIYYWLVAEDDLSPAERASWRKVVEEIKHG